MATAATDLIISAKHQPTASPKPTSSAFGRTKRSVPPDIHDINKGNIIYVDGGHGKYSEDEGWGSVVDGKGNDLLAKYFFLFPDMNIKKVSLPGGDRYIIISSFSDVKFQQNNGAELLAMVAGIRIALFTKKYFEVRSDSQLCVKYWSKSLNIISSQKMSLEKISWINLLISLRKNFEEKGGSIVQINGSENIADLGYH